MDRRTAVRTMLVGIGLFSLFPDTLLAEQYSCKVEHPFMPPNPKFKGSCHNCGMKRPMWARTWHTYKVDGKHFEVCSVHCLAEASLNSSTKPEDIKVALYFTPEKNLPVEKVFYVLGSRAAGTMTMESKLAFSSKAEAETFVMNCGGTIVSFADAYKSGLLTIRKENRMINARRVKKGKIKEPVPQKDVCPVCGMFAAKYPNNKCQLQTSEGEVVHFCATQCMFEFIKNPNRYGKPGMKPKFIWVTDYENGGWVYARNAYYVVNTPVLGPMGKEAFPFINAMQAKKFAAVNGGKVLRFHEVTFEKIMM